MTRSDRAAELFQKGFNCSQAVFSAFSPSLGLEEAKALKIACPFGAGMGRMQETCGAVTGAFLVFGLQYGKNVEGDDEAKEHTYELVLRFSERFKSLHSSICCRELLGVDINTDEGRKIAREKDLFKTRCPLFVRDAAEIAGELL